MGGVTKLSKERIFIELNKILKLKNFEELNKDKNFLEIFILIFPEFKYLDRVSNFSTLRKLLPNILNNNNKPLSNVDIENENASINPYNENETNKKTIYNIDNIILT